MSPDASGAAATSLSFVLVAPVSERVEQPVDDRERASTDQGGLLRSRREFSTRLLHQRWASLEVTPGGGWTVDEAELATVGDLRVAVLRVRTTQGWESVEALEQALSEVCTAALAPRGMTPRWVNRTFVGEDPPREWMMPRIGSEPVELDHESNRVTLGWANNVLLRMPSPADWADLRAGLVDAQVLYVQVADVVHGSGDVIRRLAADNKVGSLVSDTQELNRAWIMHELAMDEFQAQVQGWRRLVAQAHLSVWEFGELRQRASRRVTDLQTLTDQELSRRGARYQSAVEMILFALALSALLQTAMALIQTAFGGGTTNLPGGEEGMLAWIRATNLDLLLGLALSASAMILVLVLWLRKGSRLD